MSPARRGINLMQINRSILLRGSYANIRDYVALTKPRVMSLVVFTALVGLMVAPGGIDPFAGVVALLCIAAGAGAAGALNMWYDADIDAVMARTALGSIGFRTDAWHLRHSDARHVAEHRSGCAACFHNILLCRRLHDVAQTPNTAKYRHWWCGWRTPSGNRLGCGHRKCWARTAHPVPDHLPLDATALLGTVAQSCRRIRPRRRADAAGRSRKGRNETPDSPL